MTMTSAQARAMIDEEYLGPKQVVEKFPGLTVNTLAIWRHRRIGPPYLKLGRATVYPASGLAAWLESCVVEARR